MIEPVPYTVCTLQWCTMTPVMIHPAYPPVAQPWLILSASELPQGLILKEEDVEKEKEELSPPIQRSLISA